jgi:CBS domain-containing protein
VVSAPTLIAAARAFLGAHPPFSLLTDDDLEFLAQGLEIEYFASGETLIDPSAGVPAAMWIVRQGLVQGWRRPPGDPSGGLSPEIDLTPGEAFPVGALLAERAVVSAYRAASDVFCWRLPKPAFDALLARSPVFLDFCKRRTAALLDLSNQALQANYAAQATQWRSMNEPLGSLARRAPISCAPEAPIGEVFERMEREAVGAMLVVARRPDGSEAVEGIFTRQDVIGRVVLPRKSLEAPIGDVMSSPVRTMQAHDTVGDAVLAMATYGIRHLPVMREGRLAGVVTERDLFVLQRRTLRQISDAIARATEVDALATVADDIRHWSRSLVAQGVAADFITRLISRLNDQLSQRLIGLEAASRGLAETDFCWLALGSEGREEQTIATDQDNALILANEVTAHTPWLAFADAVNRALDRCGYPLCKGGIMAGRAQWCLTLEQWQQRFEGWIDRGDPTALLNASISFDFRPLAGNASLASALRDLVTARAKATPRFLKQMSDNALRNGPPATWTGGLLGTLFSREEALVDLKLHGTAPFVDAARLLALAFGVRATGTADRLERLAKGAFLPADEAANAIAAFQFLQSLRLRIQLGQIAGGDAAAPPSPAPDNPNLLDTRVLSAIDRRILKESFRQARALQQRLAADYPG